MKRFKTILLVMVVTLSIVLLSACGSDKDNSNDDSSNNNTPSTEDSNNDSTDADVTSKGGTVDVVWFADSDTETATFREIWASFQNEKGYENYELNLIETPFGSLNDKIKTMISGNTPPAMARMVDSTIGQYYNFAMDITDKVGGTEAFSSKYAPMLAQYYTHDDKVLGVPMEGTVNGMLYNKELFDAAGITVPQTYDEAWTWEEWEENLLAVKESQGTEYALLWDYSPHRFSTLFYSLGGQIFNEDYSEVIINDENGVKALEYFISLADKGILDPSTWIGSADPNNLFRTGQYPVHIGGSWMIGNYSDLPFEWGVMPFPYDDSSEANHTALGGGKFMIGFDGLSEDIEKVTSEFLIYISDVQAQTKWVEATYSLPSNLSVQPEYDKNNDKLTVFAEQFQNINPRTAHDWAYQVVMSPLYNDYRTEVAGALFGDKTAQEAFDEVKRLAEEIIAEQ